MDAILKADYCRCCLLNTTDTENELINMSQTFNYQNQQITLYDGYFETTGAKKEFEEIPLTENRICQFCVNELENAFVFKKLCLEANQILKRKYEEAKNDEDAAQSPAASPSKKKGSKQKAQLEEPAAAEVEDIEEPATPTTNRKRGKGRGKKLADEEPQPSTSVAEEQTAKPTRKRKSTKTTEEVVEETSPKTPARNRIVKSKEVATDEIVEDETDDATTPPGPNDADQEPETPEDRKMLIMSNIIEDVDGKFQCGICLKTTTSKAFMHRHIRCHFTKSTGDKPETPGMFPCTGCDRVFTCRSGQNKHFNKEHLNVRQTCEVCHKVFKSRSGLHSHTKAYHLNMRFECLICSQEFKAVNALKEHNRIQHENIRFDCKLCGHQCRKVQDLWVHSFKHRGFLPFACKMCDYKTAVKSNYKSHLIKQHHLVWNEKLYGYNKETREEVLSYVRDKPTNA